MAVGRDMVVDVDRDLSPLGVLVRDRRQGFEGGFVDGLKERCACALEFLEPAVV